MAAIHIYLGKTPFGLLASVARMVNKLRVLDRIAERRFRRILGTQIAQNRSILARLDRNGQAAPRRRRPPSNCFNVTLTGIAISAAAKTIAIAAASLR